MPRSALVLLAAAIVLAACGTDAVGVDVCRQVEEARCRKAPSCGVDLTLPIHRDTGKQDVEACIRWYHDACLHGLTVTDPGGPKTLECVQAIKDGDCETLRHPETNGKCAWLNPTPATDAGVDADAAPPPAEAAAPPDAAIPADAQE